MSVQQALIEVPREQLDRRSRGWGYDANRRRYFRQDVHRTPRALFEELDREFGFTLDVCAMPENAMCSDFFTPEEDGLNQPWYGTCWMNPPYSQIPAWMCKAYYAACAGATVVCLVPVRADLAWWHDYALRGEIRWIRGRLRFEGIGNRSEAPFASCLVVFRAQEPVS